MISLRIVKALPPRLCHHWPAFFLVLILTGVSAPAALAEKPNIVLILADDLGYGDVHGLNPVRGKIPTPCLDQFAAEGMTLSEAHSTSSVCTPSRYGILTGRYNWRSRLQAGVPGGFAPPLIAPDRFTLADLMKQNGYATACIGKWHLGLTFGKTDGKRDLSQPIKNGPLTHGFDYFYGIAASLDMAPFAFIENDHFTQVPSVTKTWIRPGLAAPDFEAIDVLPALMRHAKSFIATNATANKSFFLYLPLTSPHTPLVPTKEWQGKSGLGDYGDFVMQTDWTIGQVLAQLEKSGVADNTLVIIASDNGFAPYVGARKLEQQGHFPSADRRGYKADIWDGGHRIPLLARWPGKIKSGSTSDQLVSLVDLLATCADVLGAKLPANSAEDSVSLLPILSGKATAPVQAAVVFHSNNGSFAIRQGRWKLELCPDSGGWSDPKPGSAEAKMLPPVQLYDMAKDVGERENEAKTHPEIVTRLTELLEKYVADGRSTPGDKETNDVPVNIRKSEAKADTTDRQPAD